MKCQCSRHHGGIFLFCGGCTICGPVALHCFINGTIDKGIHALAVLGGVILYGILLALGHGKVDSVISGA